MCYLLAVLRRAVPIVRRVHRGRLAECPSPKPSVMVSPGCSVFFIGQVESCLVCLGAEPETQRWRRFKTGRIESRRPRSFANTKMPNVPVTSRPAAIACRRASRSSNTSRWSGASSPNARTSVPPLPRLVTSGNSFRSRTDLNVTQGSCANSGRRTPRLLPSANSAATAVGTCTDPNRAGSRWSRSV